MKKTFEIMLAAVCTASLLAPRAFALEDGVLAVTVEQSERNGAQIITESYLLPVGADPEALVKEPYELDGWQYAYDTMESHEIEMTEEKPVEESVTVETAENDMQSILSKLPLQKAYQDDDGFTGVMILDATTLKIEESGRKQISCTVTGTKTLSGLSRNDPALIPQTMSKSGVTLKLKNVNWSVDGFAIDESNLGGGTYTATASYAGTGCKTVVTGYQTTAAYRGTASRTFADHVECTITYLGTPLPEPSRAPEYITYAGCAVLALLALSWVLHRWYISTVRIYSAKTGEDDFKLVRRKHLSRKKPLIQLYEPSNCDYAAVIKKQMCRKMVGRTITVAMEKCAVHQLVKSGESDLWILVEPGKAIPRGTESTEDE